MQHYEHYDLTEMERRAIMYWEFYLRHGDTRSFESYIFWYQAICFGQRYAIDHFMPAFGR